MPRVEDVSTRGCNCWWRRRGIDGGGGGAAPSEWRNASKVCCARDLFVRPEKIIDAEFFILVQRQFSDHRAERDLRRFHVHFIENFFHFHHHLAIAEHDDGVRALVSDDFGVTHRDRFRRGIDRLSLEFFGNV